ncbi:hypothetical protein [Modicisalibacter luteus]|uniref:Uncharacterized protein n=1 Tax=Modicisalibacter luteus TaxID=453962 RepID=A0ABV7M2W6_9GAMM|nr:hypothetical protein [Halomonas lutea]GHA85266.1 hypothetical protein GCM10007159_02940 [Halomonas lutea]
MKKPTITAFQGKVLSALYAESVETRRDVTTVMVCIAANAGTESNQRKVIATLGELRELGLVVSSDGGWAWTTTVDGTQAAQRIQSGSIKWWPAKAAEPKKKHGTLLPVKDGAPRPVTCPDDVLASADVAKQEVLPPVENLGRFERVAPDFRDELLKRAAVMVLQLLAQTKGKSPSPERLEELAWLQDTGRMIEQAGGVHV